MDEAQDAVPARGIPSPTDDPRVDRILGLLDGLEDLPVAEHADVYLDVHDRLAGELDPDRALRQAGAHGAP
ncbi:hypothetical protein C4K88_06455 [Arthrobacter pityocampae]|uniref:Uncharacterized protein n=1 Tax=Arthrobacter pityocampae TaxID=547334 RepID=A0A2S5J0D9_9MICC|nr:hypothetical protein [Arthrobacter pityocampae]PPB50288.1 hypothetical protein C4K88_06455 [Arthrobacter pityocampae]